MSAGPRGPLVIDDEACGRLHAASLQILERTGVDVRDARARGLLSQAGARVEGDRCRIPEGLVRDATAAAPERFALAGRAPDGSLDLDIRPGSGYFGNGTDCLYVRDVRTGDRRRAQLADVQMLAAGCELLPNIDFVMSGVLPADAPMDRIELAQFAAMLKGTRKPLVLSPASGGETLPQLLEMAALAGRSESFAVLGMSNPPLLLDASCLGKAIACAAASVPFICGPGNQMGATGPASVAGSVAVGHAETLAALVVHQLARPGAPFVYGTGAGTTFDMRSMVDVWSSPEGTLADVLSCRLATMLGLPSWSFAGNSEANTMDGQWAAETAITIVTAAQMGASMLHDAGEFGAGTQNSLASIVLADTVIGYARRFLAGVTVNDETLQLEDVAAVGPGGDYLGRRYTRLHHRDAWSSPLFETTTYERWHEAGERTLADRLRESTADLVKRAEPVLSREDAEMLDAFWNGQV